jgi:hypothetical protein
MQEVCPLGGHIGRKAVKYLRSLVAVDIIKEFPQMRISMRVRDKIVVKILCLLD